MSEPVPVSEPALGPAEKAIAAAKERAMTAIEGEDPSAAIEACRSLRSGLWQRERAAQADAARKERLRKQAQNRETFA